MNRTVKQTPVNDSDFKYEVQIEGETCPSTGLGNRLNQVEMLRLLAATPGLTDCGSLPFRTLRMFHDGERWMVTLEAVGP